jgi:hypothetical protein
MKTEFFFIISPERERGFRHMEWSGFGFHEHEQYLDKPNNYQARELHCQQYRM